MKKIYLDTITTAKDSKRLSYETLHDRTGLSVSKLQRIFTGQVECTVDDFELICEKGLELDMRDVYAPMGKQEFHDSEEFGYKGAKELLADFAEEKKQIRAEYQVRIDQLVATSDERQKAFTLALDHLEKQYRKNADYLTGLVARSEEYNAKLTERAVIAEKESAQANSRADAAELENRTTRKKMYKLFSSMLLILLLLFSFTIFLIVADVPYLGGGNL